MQEAQRVELPRGLCRGLTDELYQALYAATIVHTKPLANALLGDDFRVSADFREGH